MVRFLCVGLGEFLTFAAMVLCIFANIGQLTNNIVSRNIKFVSVQTGGLANALTNANVNVPAGLEAQDQASAIAQGNGIKNQYDWGLYNYCGGASSGSARSCVDSNFGFEWQPVDALLADAPADSRNALTGFLPSNTFTDSNYLGKFSKPAFYLVFIGTVLSGLAWLTGFLAHRFAFFIAAILAFLAALTLGVGAAIFTAIYTKARDAVGNQYGLDVKYGNALWLIWGAFVADVLSIVPYIISCCTGRDKY